VIPVEEIISKYQEAAMLTINYQRAKTLDVVVVDDVATENYLNDQQAYLKLSLSLICSQICAASFIAQKDDASSSSNAYSEGKRLLQLLDW
jgi:hypothetical protein